MKVKARIFPGSMGACQLALDLFGLNHVNPGAWGGPVFVFDVEKEDVLASMSLLQEHNLQIVIYEEE